MRNAPVGLLDRRPGRRACRTRLVDERLAEQGSLDRRLELELEKVAVEVMDDVGLLEGDPAAGFADQPLRRRRRAPVGALSAADQALVVADRRGRRGPPGSARASVRCRPRHAPCPSPIGQGKSPRASRASDLTMPMRAASPSPSLVSSSWFSCLAARGEPQFVPGRPACGRAVGRDRLAADSCSLAWPRSGVQSSSQLGQLATALDRAAGPAGREPCALG